MHQVEDVSEPAEILVSVVKKFNDNKLKKKEMKEFRDEMLKNRYNHHATVFEKKQILDQEHERKMRALIT